MRAENAERTPTVALIPWGNVIEDFLDPNGLTFEDFCRSFRGSWMFGYVDALRTADVRTLLFVVSRSVDSLTRRVHEPTGAALIAAPPAAPYRWLLPRFANPYGRTVESAFGQRDGVMRLALTGAREIAPYLATPLVRLGRVLRGEPCDALLCQEYEFPRFDMCALVSRVTNVPLYASFQGGDYQRWRLERLTRGPAMRSARGFVVPPAREAERVVFRYGVEPARIASIPNPVDVDFWKPVGRAEARASLRYPDDVRIAVWHGRMQLPKKGLDVLLDAWSRVGNRSDRRLVLVGGGADAAHVQELVARRGLSNVELACTFEHRREPLRTYLAAADVYAFPSRHEGFPVALAEALACGLPAVASDVSGVAELLGSEDDSCGIIVPSEDAEALAVALGRLLDAPNLSARLGARSRRRAVEHFGQEAVGRRLRTFLLGDTLSGPDCPDVLESNDCLGQERKPARQ
jgi:glycosyltransferase involved in cell wall biosynthesis